MRRSDAALASQRGIFVFEPNPRGSYGQECEAFTQANIKDFGYGDLRPRCPESDLDVVQIAERADRSAAHWYHRLELWRLHDHVGADPQTSRFKAAVAGRRGLSDWQSYYGTNNIDTWMIPYFWASVYDDPKVYERSSPPDLHQ